MKISKGAQDETLDFGQSAIVLVTSFYPFGTRENWLSGEIENADKEYIQSIVVPRKYYSLPSSVDSEQNYILMNERMISREIIQFTAVNLFRIFNVNNFRNLIEQSHNLLDFFKRCLVLPKAYFLASKLKKRNVQHVHAYSTTTVATIGLVLSELLGVPFSFTLHTSSQLIEKHRTSYGHIIKSSAVVRTISQKTKRDLENFFSELNFEVRKICLGVDCQKLTAPKAGVVNFDQTSIITMACVLERYKGVDVAILAMKQIVQSYPNAVLEIYGSGSQESYLRKLSKELGLAKNVVFMGHVNNSLLLETMRNRRGGILLLTSQVADNVEEGIPVILMEAMACGMIPVATDNGAISEIIVSDKNGYIVPQGNVEGIVEQIKKIFLITDEQKSNLVECARSKIINEFNSKANSEKFFEMLLKFS